MPRKKETAEPESNEEPVQAVEEEPTDADHQDEGGPAAGVTEEAVEAPGEANEPSPASYLTCVNHPDREATKRTVTAGANALVFCDECARNAGEGTVDVSDPAEIARQDEIARQQAEGAPVAEGAPAEEEAVQTAGEEG